jgi:protein phosphatase 1 regulatory subunit 7
MRNVLLDGVPVHVSFFLTNHYYYRAAPCTFLVSVREKNKKEAIADFRRLDEQGQCDGLYVEGVADLSFLEECSDLRYLEVVEQKNVNTRYLDGLYNLRGLRLQSPGAGIDFACFEELEVFIGDWHIDNHNVDQARELRILSACQFKPRSCDLRVLAGLPRLERLDLTQTNITSLAGLETLEDLRYVDFAYAPKLESLDTLACPGIGIRELCLSHAKRISSYKPIASLSHLRRLQLSSCAPMADLRWTAGMNRLDMFTFVETNVEDGDLSPLLDLPALQSAHAMDKKHYNYKFRALNELLNQRRLAASPHRTER